MSTIQTAQFVIPSNPAVKEKIKKVLQSCSDSLTKISAERDLIKETIDELSKEHDIPKKYLSKSLKIYHNQNFNAVTADNEASEELYIKLFDVQQ